jgi:radical SAM superfamily enzyme YgiQ (UPF0313 family)
MKILLVNPAGSNWVAGMEDRTATVVRTAPIGILSIAAWLLREDHQVRVLDLNGRPADRIASDFTRLLDDFCPDCIGFSAVTSNFPNACRLAEMAKERAPRTLIVFGGVHVSALRWRVMADYPVIDLVVTGEGEQAMAQIAAGVDRAAIQGLIYRDGDDVRDNGIRTELLPLDELPLPAYHLLEGFPRGYEGALFNYPKGPTATIISSRGCPYDCSYCDRSVFRSSFRYNSAPRLYEHMALLRRDYGIRHVFFYDDLFTFNRKRIEELCAMLLAKPLGMTFNCAVRVGHIDDDLLRLLKKAGCWMVSLGVESGAPEILARHKSNISFPEMRETVLRIRRAGLRAKGLFMMGLPGETEETIRTTAEFISALELDDMNMTKFTPFPGSPLYRTIREEGEFSEQWELMNCMNFVFVPRGIASKERLDELYNRFIREFYTGRNWVRKFPRLMLGSPDSVRRIVRNFPAFLRIRREFAAR